MKKTKLYIVPTPVGNLEDMTFRAIKILKEVHLIGAEDTRTSGKLMKHFGIETQLRSYHKFNEKSRVKEFISYLKEGKVVAIVSDAGTPGISDPAEVIVKEVIAAGFEVETLPGATAFVPALVSSGLSSERFYFVGFLSDKKKDRDETLKDVSKVKASLIFYEAPHRIEKFLGWLKEALGNRQIALGREISKMFETYYRGTIDQFLNEPELIKYKGEFVVVVEGFTAAEINDEYLTKLLTEHIENGNSAKEAIKLVKAETGVSKNRLYELALKLKEN